MELEKLNIIGYLITIIFIPVLKLIKAWSVKDKKYFKYFANEFEYDFRLHEILCFTLNVIFSFLSLHLINNLYEHKIIITDKFIYFLTVLDLILLYNFLEYLYIEKKYFIKEKICKHIKDNIEDGVKDNIEDGVKDNTEDGVKDNTKDGVKDNTKDGAISIEEKKKILLNKKNINNPTKYIFRRFCIVLYSNIVGVLSYFKIFENSICRTMYLLIIIFYAVICIIYIINFVSYENKYYITTKTVLRLNYEEKFNQITNIRLKGKLTIKVENEIIYIYRGKNTILYAIPQKYLIDIQSCYVIGEYKSHGMSKNKKLPEEKMIN